MHSFIAYFLESNDPDLHEEKDSSNPPKSVIEVLFEALNPKITNADYIYNEITQITSAIH